MLNFDPSWRLMSPGKIAGGVISDLTGLIRRVAGQHGDRQHIVEHYKGHFADAANRPHHHSSSLRWAETDLDSYMREAGEGYFKRRTVGTKYLLALVTNIPL